MVAAKAKRGPARPTFEDALPPGLHVHLLAGRLSMGLGVWLEGRRPPGEPRESRSQSGLADHHGASLLGDGPPPFVCGNGARWRPSRFVVKLPALGNGVPLPLPGLMPSWDLTRFSVRGRVVTTRHFYVGGWVVPVEDAVFGFGRWLRQWRNRFGPGFVAPQAEAVLSFLEELRLRLEQGPLLPTLRLHPDDCDLASPEPPDPRRSRHTRDADLSMYETRPSDRLALVPPISIGELHRMLEPLAATRWIGASLQHSGYEPEDALSERVPLRFARFVIELLGAAAAPRTDEAVGPGPAREELVRRLAVGDPRVVALHNAHRSVLYPTHPLYVKPVGLDAHLHGRLLPDATNADSFRLQLGLTKAASQEAFLSIAELMGGETVHDAMVDAGNESWRLPAAAASRDWKLLARTRKMLRRPELLAAAECRLNAREAQAVRALSGEPHGSYDVQQWCGYTGAQRPRGRKAASCAFTCAVAAEQVRLHVQWMPVTEPPVGNGTGPAVEGGAGLGRFRFTPKLQLTMAEQTMSIAEAEQILHAAAADAELLRVGKRLVTRSDLAAALLLADAREKVLRKLARDMELSWLQVLQIEDEWLSNGRGEALVSSFDASWKRFVQGLSDVAQSAAELSPTGFHGTLRPYQKRGLAWLALLAQHGFGATLADDMGLGKTIQVLALFTLLAERHQRESDRAAPSGNGPRAARAASPHLVVCPTSVVFNWAAEAKRFAPTLRTHVHQGGDRAADAEQLTERARRADVMITSFALCRLDLDLLKQIRWQGLVVDEAHSLKNAQTQQTRAVKQLESEFRIALTGTPVENQLGDLWSILDFCNPGLLGGLSRFARVFASPINAGDGDALARLQGRIAPFVLRRTKRDPHILADLPDKQEQEVHCPLTSEQRALYAAMSEAAVVGLQGKDGIARKAHLLKAFTHLKQICNHPESFEPEHPNRLRGRSGKLDRALQLLRVVLDEGHAALIFTQYRPMAAILQRACADVLDVDAPYYHGQLSAAARTALVEDFQDPDGPPVLIVSLRAGGLGLNLTRASVVLHYDRWWNPAVEEQATDRVHRLGQTQKVLVYKMVTRDTLEERIAEMLAQKKELATKVLAHSDESWLTKMDDDQVRAFLSLSPLRHDGEGAQVEAPGARP